MADDAGIALLGVGLARRIPITNDLDIVAARVEGRNLAREMGFGIIDQARIATAISELARNVVLYAHSGEILLSPIGARCAGLEEGQERSPGDGHTSAGAPAEGAGLEIVCRDQGPGIPNVEEVLNRPPAADLGTGAERPGPPDLWRTGSTESGAPGEGEASAGREASGLGVGLSGTRRLMDEFQITSQVGVGTTVVARHWLRAQPKVGE